MQLDTIGQGYDLCRRDTTTQGTPIRHPFQERIDMWEEESITKIRRTADVARADLQVLLDQRANRMRDFIDKNTAQMQSSRESDDYTETDLNRWTDQLKELQNLFEQQLTFRIANDRNINNAVQMIKVYEEEAAASEDATPTALQERFCNPSGKLTLNEEGLLATCYGSYWDGSTAYGTNLYSSGVTRVRFRIENKGRNNIFFGIKPIDFYTSMQASTAPDAYGWWELDQAIESVSGHRTHHDRVIRTGDELTLVLDCNQRQISLEHHRTRTTLSLPVELEKCPFPWKLFVTLRTGNDSVRILPLV